MAAATLAVDPHPHPDRSPRATSPYFSFTISSTCDFSIFDLLLAITNYIRICECKSIRVYLSRRIYETVRSRSRYGNAAARARRAGTIAYLASDWRHRTLRVLLRRSAANSAAHYFAASRIPAQGRNGGCPSRWTLDALPSGETGEP